MIVVSRILDLLSSLSHSAQIIFAAGYLLAAIWFLSANSRNCYSWLFLIGSIIGIFASILSSVNFYRITRIDNGEIENISTWFSAINIAYLVAGLFSSIGILGLARIYTKLLRQYQSQTSQ